MSGQAKKRVLEHRCEVCEQVFESSTGWRQHGVVKHQLQFHIGGPPIPLSGTELERKVDKVRRAHMNGAQRRQWKADQEARLCRSVGLDTAVSDEPEVARAISVVSIEEPPIVVPQPTVARGIQTPYAMATTPVLPLPGGLTMLQLVRHVTQRSTLGVSQLTAALVNDREINGSQIRHVETAVELVALAQQEILTTIWAMMGMGSQATGGIEDGSRVRLLELVESCINRTIPSATAERQEETARARVIEHPVEEYVDISDEESVFMSEGEWIATDVEAD